MPESAAYFHFDGGIRDVYAGNAQVNKDKGAFKLNVIREFLTSGEELATPHQG